jgi:hypothetical protein
MVEDIPDEQLVSRHIDSPHKWKPEEREFVEERLFEFPKPDEAESLVWRKYAPTLDAVHKLGCGRQQEKRATKPNWTYEGAITTHVAAIRSIQTKDGHGFSVVHAPDEGIWHAHVCYRKQDGQEFNRVHKMDLKEHLRGVFSDLEPHTCC